MSQHANTNGVAADPEPPALKTALRMLDKGLRPIPIRPGQKRPIGEKWGEVSHTPDSLREVYRQHPGAGVGVLLGAVGGVIDIEVDDPERGASVLARMFPDGVPDTLSFRSNKGPHYLFAYDPRLAAYGETRITGQVDEHGKVKGNPHYLGLELRIGTIDPAKPKMMQSVIPPTPKADGTPRRWERGRELLPLPQTVFDDLDKHAVKIRHFDREAVMAAVKPHIKELAAEWGLRLTGKTNGAWAECHAIDRDDDEPLAGINLETGVYHDFGNPGDDLSFFDLASRLRPGEFPHWQAALNALGDSFDVKAGRRPPPKDSADKRAAGDDPRESQPEALLRLAADAKLYHADDGRTFATILVNGHLENHLIRDTSFRRWLTREFYTEAGKPASGEAIKRAIDCLDAKAAFDGGREKLFVRVGGHAGDDPTYYLYLGDASWRAVAVDGRGWEVVDAPPVKFRQPKGMMPLPIPERGGTLDDLRRFVNVADEDWRLMIACLTSCFRPVGPYPIVVLQGEQGSAKSTTARVVRRAIDPNAAPLRCEPKEDRDLMIAANNSWVIAIDNISSLGVWFSDALCRLATEGGFATRTLYADDEETLFNAKRPILLNGIEDIASRGDLIDRCVIFRLPTIPGHKRREEGPFWREFEAAWPKILGALLDAVSGGIRELPNVKLASPPRMADFARWGEAVGRALGWPDGAFLKDYEGNRGSAQEIVLEDCPVASAVRRFMDDDGNTTWEGTAAELLGRLEKLVGEKGAASKRWPKSPRGLSGQLRRAAPALRAVGIDVDFDERDPGRQRSRRIRIVRVAEGSDERPSDGEFASDRPSADGDDTTDFRETTCEDRSRDSDGADGSDGSSPSVSGDRAARSDEESASWEF